MTRRRLVLAILVLLALGVIWSWFTTGLSAEERALVGTWSSRTNGVVHQRWALGPESVARIEGRNGNFRWTGRCRWTAGPGGFVLDSEPSSVRRAFRPLLGGLWVSVGATWQYSVERLTGDRLVLVAEDGTREEWVREP